MLRPGGECCVQVESAAVFRWRTQRFGGERGVQVASGAIRRRAGRSGGERGAGRVAQGAGVARAEQAYVHEQWVQLMQADSGLPPLGQR
jgi:hypothetical protein